MQDFFHQQYYFIFESQVTPVTVSVRGCVSGSTKLSNRPTWCPTAVVLCRWAIWSVKALDSWLTKSFWQDSLNDMQQQFEEMHIKCTLWQYFCKFWSFKLKSPQILNEDPILWSAHSTTPPQNVVSLNFILPNWPGKLKLSDLHKSYYRPFIWPDTLTIIVFINDFPKYLQQRNTTHNLNFTRFAIVVVVDFPWYE